MPNLVISGMPGDAELLLGVDLGRQAVAVPAEAALDALAAHRLVARHGVLHEAGQEVAVVRQAVGERRPVVEDELVGVGAPANRRLERVALGPGGQDVGLDRRKGRLRVDFGVHLRAPVNSCCTGTSCELAIPPCLLPPADGNHSVSPAMSGWTRSVLMSSRSWTGRPFFRKLGGDCLVDVSADPTWLRRSAGADYFTASTAVRRRRSTDRRLRSTSSAWSPPRRRASRGRGASIASSVVERVERRRSGRCRSIERRRTRTPRLGRRRSPDSSARHCRRRSTSSISAGASVATDDVVGIAGSGGQQILGRGRQQRPAHVAEAAWHALDELLQRHRCVA